ncbi:MAG: tyrosine-type recombinase/integrase [Sphingomicrobium sp.]
MFPRVILRNKALERIAFDMLRKPLRKWRAGMATKRFTDPWLRGLKASAEGSRMEWLDEAETGLVVSINAKRRVTFWLIGRFPKPEGKASNPSRRVLGDFRPDDPKDRVFIVKSGVPALTLDRARQKAREWKAAIAQGIDPGAPATEAIASATAPDTVSAIFDEYLKRHVKKEGRKDARGNPIPPLRSASEIERIFDRYILADLEGAERWRNRPIASITRREVTALLDTIEDRHGAAQADAVLAQLSSMFNWHAARDGDFISPIVRGMKRSRPSERKRKRVLSDFEIGVLWRACEGQGTFGALCRMALLTGQRREKITQMRWEDVSDDGLWTIPAEDREKGNAEYLRLSPHALKIIRALPRVGDKPYVFQGRLTGPINGFSKAKAELDAAMAVAAGGVMIEPWVLHDLRRTAKTLMIRAGVSPHDSERVLGHVIPGVEGVYDRHAYLSEKTAALRKLASLIGRIVEPRPNVVPMRKTGR